jgi:hypothetical protein
MMELNRPRVISLPYRNTRYGGRTVSWVFEWYGGRWVRVRPHFVELSRTGRHGTEYFEVRSDRYVVVTLMISNSGSRTYNVAGTDSEAVEKVKRVVEMWVRGARVRPEDVLSVLNGQHVRSVDRGG